MSADDFLVDAVLDGCSRVTAIQFFFFFFVCLVVFFFFLFFLFVFLVDVQDAFFLGWICRMHPLPMW